MPPGSGGTMQLGLTAMTVEHLLESLELENVSDIFLADGLVPSLRINTEVTPRGTEKLPAGEIAAFRNKILSPAAREHYLRTLAVDTAYETADNRRFRINFYASRTGDNAAIRPVRAASDLDFSQLALPETIRKLAEARRGLVLICGATGSGKSTTLAAMVNEINLRFKKHILTLEDPIEYTHTSKNSLISQCEVNGFDSFFTDAVRNAMRKNPDVIVIGEMRDMETAQAAINAALTGHLVLSTIHTGNCVSSIERIINLFPDDKREQLALDISNALLGIAAQRLLPRADKSGMIPAVEYLPATPMVKKLISKCLFNDLEAALREGATPGMENFQRAVFDLWKKHQITKETAFEYVDNPDELTLLFEGLRSGIDTFRTVYGEKETGSDQSIDISTLLYSAIRNGSSDLILTTDTPPCIRIDGTIRTLDLPPLRPEDTSSLLYGLLTPHQRIEFEEKREIDLALSLNLKKNPDGSVLSGRFRINAFHQRGAVGIVARVINTEIPDPAKLGLPPILSELSKRAQGLILITGPTGSGKSTTLASIVDHINRTRDAHIITIEDPIEFVHKNRKSVIEQRELHSDTLNYAGALKNALRQDPDVILVGEMRDIDTMAAALTAAETGHLVLATIHTNNGPQTIDRIVDSFPDHQQNQIRLQLAGVILCVVSQRLLPRIDGKGRIAVFEVMVGTPPIQALIRDGKTHLLKSSMETGRKDGMVTMERALTDLAALKIVPPEEIKALMG